VEAGATPARRAALRKTADASGLRIACLATSLTYADPARKEEMLRQTRERIDLAADLGVPVIRVFGGKIPEGIGREEAMDHVADSLRAAADHAGERGVTVCMETHDDWCDPGHVAAVHERVNHEAVGVNWDIMHPVRTRKASMDQAFDILRPWIRHVHLHDGTGPGITMVPIGTGDIDHRRALALLLGTNYQGFLSGEWINWEPCEVHLPRELGALKEYERELASAAG
jgi:sugar phosphate isomerase/epimerase